MFRFVLRRSYSKQPQNIINLLHFHKPGEKVEVKNLLVKGWVKSVRKHKENVFIDVNDGSTEQKLQVLVPHQYFPSDLSAGSSIRVDGVVTLSPKGQIELSAENVRVVGSCSVSEGYPIAPKKQYAPEYIRQYLHLRPRTKTFSSLLRVRSATMLAIHEYFNSEGYVHVHTPILTSNDCEGAGEVFKTIPNNVNLLNQMKKEDVGLEEAFFDKKVFLSVSGQLHLEAAAHGLSKVYTLGPTFRAENSRTRFHLSEFYMLEVEVAFVDELEDLMAVIEKFVKDITKRLVDTCRNDIKVCQGGNAVDLSWIDKKFPVITHTEAINVLKNNQNKFKEGYKSERGISKEHEIFLVEYFGNVPTFVINWPKIDKPFYMRECKHDNTKVAALDLLAPEVGEIIGGSLRENDYNKLKQKLPKAEAPLDWYLDLRKFGGVPTAGFGMGFERYLLSLLKINSIKDAIPFPRWPHNCSL